MKFFDNRLFTSWFNTTNDPSIRSIRRQYKLHHATYGRIRRTLSADLLQRLWALYHNDRFGPNGRRRGLAL